MEKRPTTNEEILAVCAEHVDPSRVRILRAAGLGIVEERREGAYVFDAEGNRFLDCRTDAGSFNVGRRHPRIVRALVTALETYDIGNYVFFSEPKAALARKLAAISPGGELTAVTYGVSGGESVDFAIKLARGVTGRPRVISARKGYHGHTGLALSAIGTDVYRAPFRPLAPRFDRVPFADVSALEEALDEDVACVLLEPVQGEGGIHVPPDDYFPRVRELCDEVGALLVVDEIQTGLGRTGKMWCVDYWAVVPDIMTIGKSLSGGLYPITAALYRKEHQRFLDENPFIHFSAFGGADLGCTVALETLAVIEEEDFCENAARMGELLGEGLAELRAKHPNVLVEHRRKGLMVGLELLTADMGMILSRELVQHGVLAMFLPHDPKVMRLLPSLVIDADQVRELLGALDHGLSKIRDGG